MTPQVEPSAADAQRNADYRRVVLLALGLFVVMVAVLGLAPLVPRLFEGEDLAKGKPWRASSMYAECHPEKMLCGEGQTSIFFHTREEDQPWVEFDLGAPTAFSGAAVENRRDGSRDVLDRAVPLVLEAGNDRLTWTKVAEATSSFTVWRPKFEPITARYVRLRSPRKTWLHLDAVRLYR